MALDCHVIFCLNQLFKPNQANINIQTKQSHFYILSVNYFHFIQLCTNFYIGEMALSQPLQRQAYARLYKQVSIQMTLYNAILK